MKYFFCFCLILINSLCTKAQTPNAAQIDTSINRAIRYLRQKKAEIYFADYLVYAGVSRNYHLPEIGNRDSLMYFFRTETGENLQYNGFARLADAKTARILQKNLPQFCCLDTFTVQALWADKLKLTPRYLDIIDTLATKGDYELTHAYLALIWLKENKHFLIKTSQFFSLETKFETRILSILNNRFGNYWCDIHSEALALLLYNKIDINKIKPLWIAQLLEAQQPDGGWWQSARNQKTLSHTVVLSVWALAAYKDYIINKIPTQYNWICR